MITELVEFIADGLVRNPDDVSVEATTTGSQVELNLTVAADDYGRIVGRSGQTINAMRTIVAAAGRRQGLSVALDVVEPERPRRGKGPQDAATEKEQASD